VNVIWTPQLDQSAARWQALADRLGRDQFAPLAPELDRDQRYPWETIKTLVEHKFTGLFLPRDFGGEGASLTATVAAVETLGSHCASTAAIMCAYQLGAFPILLSGNDAQKNLYLREMTQGRATSFALSERGAGSDAAAIEATAVREGDGWRIKGEKYWIGNGGASRYYVVFAKTEPAAGGRGISAFMVDRSSPAP
jgi:alkylation response protein AidB-like acyl-CoA dehydrogenase